MIHTIALLILGLPLLGFFLLMLLQNRIKQGGDIFSISLTGLAFLMASYMFSQIWGQAPVHVSVVWFRLQTQADIHVGIQLDNLGSFMLVLVSFISFLVQVFSVVYMRGEKHYHRYFAYLSLFTFSMLGIVLSDSLLTIYIFWELVGLSSYLLIGFWYQKRSAVRAAKKAFLVNRVGDAAFMVGIILVYMYFGTFQLEAVEQSWQSVKVNYPISNFHLTLIGFCLFCGAIGKSAQFPLQIWLPDAMEGPTPVSALIHAATMVAAGVFLVARVFFLLNVDVMLIIAFVGTITAFLGAFSALVQKDIKKVLAYSTISQLGYMMIGMGTGAYDAALFHLLTHAFFKACLFLCAGAIIDRLHQLGERIDLHFDAQNMYLMGGLRKRMPFVFACFVVAALSLIGLPFFSGFLSKDAIISGSWAWAQTMAEAGSFLFYLIPIIALFTAFLTAVYMGRAILLIFFGDFLLDKLYRKAENGFDLIQDAPLGMKVPLGILATLSLWWAFAWNPLDAEAGWFLSSLSIPHNLFIDPSIQARWSAGSHQVHTWIAMISTFLALAGLVVARFSFQHHRFVLRKMSKGYKSFYDISEESFYWDKLYQSLAVKQGLRIAKYVAWFDAKWVDGLVNLLAKAQVVVAHVIAWVDRGVVDGLVNLMAYFSRLLGQFTRNLAGGQVQTYFVVALTTLLIMFWWWLG